MKITKKRLVIGLASLSAAGMAFAWSGLFNVSASSGHWAATDWFLHWVMRNSVSTWTKIEGEKQPVDDRSLVSAAGLYAQSCAACHGAPGVAPLPVMQAAVPAAPDLAKNAREWTDGQLFWIVKHGVKFTGMPAWAAKDRDDEVRRMAAFVRALPGMSPRTYQALTRDQTETGVDATVAACTGCHGVDGRGRGAADIPTLGGQDVQSLTKALRDYADGSRPSAVMANAAINLTPADRARLARHFAAMPGLGQGDIKRDGAAADIVARGLPQIGLPACARCHDGANSKAPRIAGQKAAYIATRLRNWRGAEEIVDARKPNDMMATIARRIPEDKIDALADAISRQGPSQ